MGLFTFLTGRAPAARAASALYAAAVAQARRQEFYTALGVPDTLDGRFELIVLHVHLLCRKLGAEGQAELAQALFDTLFRDLDRNLREMGVGDPSMPRRIKAMIGAYYGRAAAYDAALSDEGDALAASIARNIHAGIAHPGSQALAQYMRDAVSALEATPAASLVEGRVEFPAVPVSAAA